MIVDIEPTPTKQTTLLEKDFDKYYMTLDAAAEQMKREYKYYIEWDGAIFIPGARYLDYYRLDIKASDLK